MISPRRPDRLLLAPLVALVVVLGLLSLVRAPSASAARTEPVTSVSVIDEPGEAVGNEYRPRTRSWDGDEVTLSRSPGRPDSGVVIATQRRGAGPEGTAGSEEEDEAGADSARLTFDAPDGRPLTTGTYDLTREPGSARVQISDGCSGPGRFTVHEIDLDAGRLWISYATQCDHDADDPDWGRATYGEVRVGVDAQTADGLLASGVVDAPAYDVGEPSTPNGLPVVNTGAAPVEVTGVSLAGRDAADFGVAEDCGRIDPGQRCLVGLRFTPRAAGLRSAVVVLDVRGPSGPDRLRTVVTGTGIGGLTRVTLDSDAGDPLLRGYQGSVGPAAHPFVTEDDRRVFVSFPGRGLSLTFSSGQRGVPLATGSYPGARRWPFNDEAPGLTVSASSRGCNTIDGEFLVHELTRDPDNRVTTFSASFVQRCDDGPGQLVGQVSFRARQAPPSRPLSDLDVTLDRPFYEQQGTATVTVAGHRLPPGTPVEVVVEATSDRYGHFSPQITRRGVVSPGRPLVIRVGHLRYDRLVFARVLDDGPTPVGSALIAVRPYLKAQALGGRPGAGGSRVYRSPTDDPIQVRIRVNHEDDPFEVERRTFRYAVSLQRRVGARWRSIRAEDLVLRSDRGRWSLPDRLARPGRLRVRFTERTDPGVLPARSPWAVIQLRPRPS